jgi:hypothetical protein
MFAQLNGLWKHVCLPEDETAEGRKISAASLSSEIEKASDS